ncbi:MAG: hypothetical protein ACYS21_10720 [Planctomycetota bacterium]|jgi:hypothetical protein
MNLLVYAAKSGGVAQHLQKVIQEIVPKKNLEIYRNFNSLSYRLQQPMNGLKIAILLAGSDQDLTDFLSLQDLLSELRIILILPNRESSTFAQAHLLGPRFMTYADSDFEDIKAVLSKMSDGQKSRCGQKALRKRN